MDNFAEISSSDIVSHIRTKTMWTGGLNPIVPKSKLLGAIQSGETIKLIEIIRPHTPALMKIIDEIIVNATDHAKMQQMRKGTPVKNIHVSFDPNTLKITVRNDGPGIFIKLQDSHSPNPIYNVEIAFSKPLTGSNITKSPNSISGGVNGLGAKLANIHSEYFEVETSDETYIYNQIWENGMRVRHEPIVKKRVDPMHTKVEFVPSYTGTLGYQEWTMEDTIDLDNWLRFRTNYAAVYLGPLVSVAYNSTICTLTTSDQFAKLLLDMGGINGEIHNTVIKLPSPPYNSYPWNVSAVVLCGSTKGKVPDLSIVNGVISTGVHVRHIKTLICSPIETKLKKLTKQDHALSEISSCIKLVIVASIPGVDWDGQRKDTVNIGKNILSQLSIQPSFAKAIASSIIAFISSKKQVRVPKVIHEKYTPASNANNSKLKNSTYLMCAEGDSALTFLRAGLSQNKKCKVIGGPSTQWCGMISIQGVIINAAKETTSVSVGEEIISVRSDKLRNNKRLLALMDAFGLDYNRKYETKEDRKTLNYGKLLLCVDQDSDGIGKIAPLVLVWINLFWPKLIEHGYIGRFVTPLIRVYPKVPSLPVMEFFYDSELTAWLESNNDWSDSYRRPEYYKGLATHSDEEVSRMFTVESFRKSIHTYTTDDITSKMFSIYYGDGKLIRIQRKQELITPVQYLTLQEAKAIKASQTIPVGRVQLNVDTKSYKHEAIKRQIPGAVDGLNPARRKILMGSTIRFSTETSYKTLKVFQLGGAVADKMQYHHGDMSLNGTIIYMAQSFAGARRFPYLNGHGQFGSRHGDGAGSARYVSVSLSTISKLINPPEDRWCLSYVFEDGSRSEPQYYIPIVPMCSLESYVIVSEGWAHESYARNMESVLKVVKNYIRGDSSLRRLSKLIHSNTTRALVELPMHSSTWPLPAERRGYLGDVRTYEGKECSFGKYEWDPDTQEIIILDLPIGVNTYAYLKTLDKINSKTGYAISIKDESTKDSVFIRISLAKGSIDKIQELYGDGTVDPIEDIFRLRSSLNANLNYYGINGEVLEFGNNYLASILYWAPLRENLYIRRVRRELSILSLKVRMDMNILRYISMAPVLDLSTIGNADAANDLLERNEFDRMDSAKLHSPEYLEGLEEIILRGKGANYDYILDLKERDLMMNSASKRKKRVASSEKKIQELNDLLSEHPVQCASLWMFEIDQFIKECNTLQSFRDSYGT